MANFSQLGLSLNTLMVTSLDNNLTAFDKLANPFPNGLSQPLGSKGGLLTAVGQSLNPVNPVTTAPIGSVPHFKRRPSSCSRGTSSCPDESSSSERGPLSNRPRS
jgi:hypothetical protein